MERNDDVLVSCDGWVLMNNEDMRDVTIGNLPRRWALIVLSRHRISQKRMHVQTTELLGHNILVIGLYHKNAFSWNVTNVLQKFETQTLDAAHVLKRTHDKMNE